MATHPDAQRKAQEEIDKVVRENTLPSFEDRGSLPYIECLLKELQRWHPATPLVRAHLRLTPVRFSYHIILLKAIPHRLMEDDTYDGTSFPNPQRLQGSQMTRLFFLPRILLP